MHDLNSKNVTEDPVKISGQSDEVVPLTSVQIFVKEEQFIHDQVDEAATLSPVQIFLKEEEGIHDQLEEVVPLSPVQVFLKEEESAYCKTEEPVLVSLVPLLPKEEHVVDESPEDFKEGSGPLVINLENSSSEDWSNHSDPLAIEQTVANASYVEYVETDEPVLVDLGATSSDGSSHPLRIAREPTTGVDSGELYNLTGSDEVVQISENGEAARDGDTDDECVEITGVSRVPKKSFQCGYCSQWFPTEGQMQMHTLTHTGRTTIWREVREAKQVKLKPKPVWTLRAQHTCGDCGEAFDRLEHLMRHRLGHIRAALRKPFSVPKLFGLPKQSGVPQPQPQVSATPDSRHTVAAVSTRTSPKRSPQRAVATSQSKRWARRKKTRRRRIS
ncbi:zinc finger protein 697-like isoform X1 [Schistocerca gregaria]|uniref:zinc finger protein 697-like isoform X1 n=1 Tax=Schistocerca gregaria TaxID=7010 RepID=UPI00211DAE21|nr:zinc finger protein 697-like isoform X1 [Schistocerca gregaria]